MFLVNNLVPKLHNTTNIFITLSDIYTTFMQSSVPFVLVIPGQGPITNFNCDNGIYHIDI